MPGPVPCNAFPAPNGHEPRACVKKKFRPDSLPGSKNGRTSEVQGPVCMSSLRRFRSLLLALACSASATAWALPKPPPPAPPPQARQPARVPPQQHGNGNNQNQQALSESVRRAERNGQVLSAEQVQYDGRDVNRVKIVDNKGRVRVYWDDPAAKPQQGQDQQGGKGTKPKPPRAGGRTRDDDDDDPTH